MQSAGEAEAEEERASCTDDGSTWFASRSGVLGSVEQNQREKKGGGKGFVCCLRCDTTGKKGTKILLGEGRSELGGEEEGERGAV